jgi:hypothetical protein
LITIYEIISGTESSFNGEALRLFPEPEKVLLGESISPDLKVHESSNLFTITSGALKIKTGELSFLPNQYSQRYVLLASAISMYLKSEVQQDIYVFVSHADV